MWLKLIFEELVKAKWFSWDFVERMIDIFPYTGKNANSKPPRFKSKKMKLKVSRRIIGTFAEISNLVRSFTQLVYDQILDCTNPYWLWLLKIRQFLRYVSMPTISDSQVRGQPNFFLQLSK